MSLLKDFRAFVLRGNVIDLAVAVVIGAAFGAVVTALVSDFITPLIAAIFGSPDFSNLTFTIHHSTFKYGHFINAIISFVLIAAAIFFVIVKPMALMSARLRKAEAEAPPAEPSDEVRLLTEIRDALRSRA